MFSRQQETVGSFSKETTNGVYEECYFHGKFYQTTAHCTEITETAEMIESHVQSMVLPRWVFVGKKSNRCGEVL